VALQGHHRLPRPWKCPLALVLAVAQTRASCRRTAGCQWRRAVGTVAAVVAAVRPRVQAEVRVGALGPVPGVAREWDEAVVVASQPAPWAAIKSNRAIQRLPDGRVLRGRCS